MKRDRNSAAGDDLDFFAGGLDNVHRSGDLELLRGLHVRGSGAPPVDEFCAVGIAGAFDHDVLLSVVSAVDV